MARPNKSRHPVVAEIFRLLVVLFGAGAGYQVALSIQPRGGAPVLGALTIPMVGIIVGAGLGYSLGGALSRRLMSTMDRTEAVLDGVTPEELVSGSIGAVGATLLASLFLWPLFLIIPPLIAASIFVFLVLLAAIFGFRVAQHRRAAVLGVIGPSTGVSAQKAARSSRLIDTSVAIDGRIVDIVRAGFTHGRIVVCEPVLEELQGLADASDGRRRAKGRRGLETLEKLRAEPGIDLMVIKDGAPEVDEVDAKLIRMCINQNLALLTMDSGMAKVASLSGVDVQNLHQLALALRPPVQAGDALNVRLSREGKEAGQAVGYLDDGTMVVVEKARRSVGEVRTVEVVSVLTTSNGRMVFAKLTGDEQPRTGIDG